MVYNKKEYSQKLALFIKEIREKYNLTQEDLSDKTNIDYKHIQRLESMKYVNDPKLSTLIKLAEGLGIKIADILKP